MTFDVEKFGVNAFTCATATVITHPIELVKTRMQVQGELTRKYKKLYSGTIQSTLLVIKKDGFFSLWKGLSAGLAYQDWIQSDHHMYSTTVVLLLSQ